MPTRPLQAHTDVQPNEIIEEFFTEEIPDPDVPLDQLQGQSVHRVMVRLYGGEFNKPTRQASVDDKENHPAEWQAFEQKAQEAASGTPRPDQGLPPEQAGEKPPPGSEPPPLGGSRGAKRQLPLVGERPEDKERKRPEEGGPSQKRDVGRGENPAGIPGRASPDADSESRDTREFADQQHHQPTPLKGPAQGGVGAQQGRIGDQPGQQYPAPPGAGGHPGVPGEHATEHGQEGRGEGTGETRQSEHQRGERGDHQHEHDKDKGKNR